MEATIDTTEVRRWKRYEENEPSGLPARIEIPSGWKTIPLKYAVEDRRRITYGIVQCGPDVADGVPYIRPVDMSDEGGAKLQDLQRTSHEIAASFSRSTVQAGDLIVSIGPSFGKVMVVTDELTGANLTQGTARVAPIDDVFPRFLFWAMRAKYTHEGWDAECSGATFRALTLETLSNNRVVIPATLEEQLAIAAFLDRETARIDAMIGHKERLIALLEEKRQAIISHAVTRGLDPNAKMKDSGVQWIGEIPDHWEVWRLKHACRLETGHTPRKSDDDYWVAEDCTIPWISLNDTKTLYANDFIDETTVSISAHGMANSSAHLIDAGAVVVNRDGARVGLAAITTRPMCVSQHMIAWVCGPRTSNHFLLHVLYAMEHEIYRITAGATIPTIGMPEVKGMTMPLPPLDEQLAIVNYLLDERQRIVRLTERLQESIERLQEYRTALISAAVTGQIDVREEVFA